MMALAKRTQNDSGDELDEAGEQASQVFIRITQKHSCFGCVLSIESASLCIFDLSLSGFNSSTVEHKNSHT